MRGWWTKWSRLWAGATHGEEMRARMAEARLEMLEHSSDTPQLEKPNALHRFALPFVLAGH
jgi:hypothetical protein